MHLILNGQLNQKILISLNYNHGKSLIILLEMDKLLLKLDYIIIYEI